MTRDELIAHFRKLLSADNPPPRYCRCDHPFIVYRNGTGHDPGCPVQWWYLEDARPGMHAREAEAYADLYIAESGGRL